MIATHQYRLDTAPTPPMTTHFEKKGQRLGSHARVHSIRCCNANFRQAPGESSGDFLPSEPLDRCPQLTEVLI
ncbi:hypothetical protein GJ744_000388 [Endocarpon pusillum]|uniref:Uncharacterized protein n=1 Tax=Endocarpon pusillum TaxID=364733 RepID=A0A8H7E2L0_9EURO|nr:hypothetical protein GJ744_000388 [Endocarpon pusillum]